MPLSRITSPFMSATANVYSPSANTVAIKTAGSDRFFVSNSGPIGVNTNTPGALNNGSMFDIYHTGSDGLMVSRVNNYIGLNGNYGSGNIHSRITSSNPNISFATNGDNARAWITPYGIALGGSVSGSSGTGIAFPATQSPSSDANTLDDYEEGTWTPSSLVSVSGAIGRYTKIGRVVIWSCCFTYAANSNGNSAYIGGLPFTCENSNGARAGSIVSYTDYTTPFTCMFNSNDISAFFYTFGGANLTYANLSGKTIYCGGSYLTTT